MRSDPLSDTQPTQIIKQKRHYFLWLFWVIFGIGILGVAIVAGGILGYSSGSAEGSRLLVANADREFNHAFAAEYQVLQEKVDGIIAAARRQLVASPCLVLDLCTGVGCGAAQLVGLFPTTSSLAAIAAIGTACGSENLSNADLLQFLLEMQETNPFELFACRHDTLKVRFLQEVQQAERLAKDMYRICSDIIHQGYGSMDKLLKAVREERRVTFWWD